MLLAQQLKSFHIIEKRCGNNSISWTYPTITDDLKSYVEAKSSIESESYFCLRRNHVWIYVIQKLKDFAIALITEEFNPLKFKSVCDILLERYVQCRNPVELVKIYLNLYTLGYYRLEHKGIILSCNLTDHKSPTNIKELIKAFNLEIILIHNAILLKRRLIIYNSNIEVLQNQLYSIVNIIPTIRNVTECLLPLIDSPKDLKGLSFFVAGTNNEEFLNEHKLYDVFVNMNNFEITISPQSKEVMAMSKIHKDLAMSMVKSCDDELEDAGICVKITQKTTDILNQVKSLASSSSVVTGGSDVKMLTINDLKNKKYTPAVENFLFNLALAENLMIL